MYIIPYNRYSEGCRHLAESLRERVPRVFRSYDRPRNTNRLVVRWGNPNVNLEGFRHVLNRDTAGLVNKLTFFQALGHISHILPWTQETAQASEWGKVVVRHSLTGSGGDGIEIWRSDSGMPLPRAPLYTRYCSKSHEYRVHVGRALAGGSPATILGVQRKVFRKTAERMEPVSWDVRSHENGFIFSAHPDLSRIPEAVLRAATAVFLQFHGLNFAAFDVIYNEERDTAYVVEGNTAPGLDRETMTRNWYADFIASVCRIVER